MNKAVLRVLSITCVAAMLIASLTGCNTAAPAATTAPATAAPTSAPAAATTAAAATEAAATASAAPSMPVSSMEWTQSTSPVTLTAFIDFNSNSWTTWGSDHVTQEITKRTGVTVTVTCATTTEHEELNSMMASGQMPDFIILNGDGPLRTTLWKQGFVAPLNKLMDQFAPNMKSVVPKDMDKIWVETDGNWYFIPGYYSDVDRMKTLQGSSLGISGFVLDGPMYEQLGKPAIATLDDYRNMLIAAKQTLGSAVPYLVYEISTAHPQDDKTNMAQLINRDYGGGPLKEIGTDGKVHLNFEDPSYLQAVEYIDSLYLAGVLNKEIFTITKTDQFKDIFTNQKAFSFWGQPFQAEQYDKDNGPYISAEPPRNPGTDLKWKNFATGIGSWPLAGISATSKNLQRAVLYYEFLLSDEGQMLSYHGVEGLDYTLQDGYPKMADNIAKDFNGNWDNFTTKDGILNYKVCWFPTNYADGLYYYWSNQGNKPALDDANINNKYAQDERINDIISVASDSPEKVIETKVFDLWTSMLPKMELAESKDACDAAYNEFLASAGKLGLAQLETAYTDSYQHWSSLLGK